VRAGSRLAFVGLAVAALSCGRIVTEVAAEFTVDSGFPAILDGGSAPDADANAGVPSDGAASFDSSFAGDGSTCHGDFSGIGANDFQVSFNLTTTQTDPLVALINQRASCGSSSDFWDIRMYSGFIYAETYDSVHYSELQDTNKTVNDGQSHAIVVRRTADELVVEVDGVASTPKVSQTSFGQLSPVQVGVDVCDGRSTPNADGTAPLSGALEEICLSGPLN
jgi:hypothetical protein